MSELVELIHLFSDFLTAHERNASERIMRKLLMAEKDLRVPRVMDDERICAIYRFMAYAGWSFSARDFDGLTMEQKHRISTLLSLCDNQKRKWLRIGYGHFRVTSGMGGLAF